MPLTIKHKVQHTNPFLFLLVLLQQSELSRNDKIKIEIYIKVVLIQTKLEMLIPHTLTFWLLPYESSLCVNFGDDDPLNFHTI